MINKYSHIFLTTTLLSSSLLLVACGGGGGSAPAAKTWGTAELIKTDSTASATFPQVAFDANGNALAVWREFEVANFNIYSNRYVAATGWGTAELIETEGHPISNFNFFKDFFQIIVNSLGFRCNYLRSVFPTYSFSTRRGRESPCIRDICFPKQLWRYFSSCGVNNHFIPITMFLLEILRKN